MIYNDDVCNVAYITLLFLQPRIAAFVTVSTIRNLGSVIPPVFSSSSDYPINNATFC